MRSRSGTLGVIVLFAFACSACDELFDDSDGTGGGGGFDGPTQSAYPQCIGGNETIDWTAYRTATVPPIGEDGTVEVPISTKGCVRFLRTVEGGRISRLQIRKALGMLDFQFDGDAGRVISAEKEWVFADWKFTDTGSHGVFDSDENGRIDTELIESWSAGNLVSQIITRKNEASDQLVERRTLTAAGPDLVRFKIEELVSGAWTVLVDAELPALQRQTNGCYQQTATQEVSCTAEQVLEIRRRMREAIAQGLECLTRHKGPLRDRHILTLLGMGLVDGFPLTCVRGNEYVGQVNLGKRTADGRVPLFVNVGMLGGCEVDAFVNSTLFHEALHVARGPHVDKLIDDLPAGSQSGLAYIYSDSIRSCEELCFGTLRTKCSCAKCLETKACDQRCSLYDSCTVRRPDGGYVMSEAVGALCSSTPPQWFNTYTACQSGCAGGSCKSMSLSCNPNCK